MSSLIAFVKQHMEQYHDPAHDIHHVLRIVGLATRIYKAECGADMDQKTREAGENYVRLLALCHHLFDDTTKHEETTAILEKLLANECECEGGDGSDQTSDHHPQALETLLGGHLDVDASTIIKRLRADIDRVFYSPHGAHSTHKMELEAAAIAAIGQEGEASGSTAPPLPSPLPSLPLQCVRDACKLDALGAIGVIRSAMSAALRNVPIFGIKNSLMAQFKADSIELPKMLHTSTAKKIAEERADVVSCMLYYACYEYLVDRNEETQLLDKDVDVDVDVVDDAAEELEGDRPEDTLYVPVAEKVKMECNTIQPQHKLVESVEKK